MKNIITATLVLATAALHAQNYNISFAGAGASTSVSSVTIDNVTQGTTKTINGTDVLNLRADLPSSISNIEEQDKKQIRIFNSSSGLQNLELFVEKSGTYLINVIDISGKTLLVATQNLNVGIHTFAFDGMPQGIFIATVIGDDRIYSEKFISHNTVQSNIPKIEYISQVSMNDDEVQMLKSASATVQMQYNSGDLLIIKGKSGNYTTVITYKATSSRTLTFNFVQCKDGSGNYYPVVKIGNQTWMAANLKTTKYNNGTNIPHVPDKDDWYWLESPGYCWYDNDKTTYGNTYGALYNWFTVNTGKLCPSGWHVPTDLEWTTLTYLLGENIAGGKLKETDTVHWKSPNTRAINSVGFTGLPAGYRLGGGSFSSIKERTVWWAKDNDTPERGKTRTIYYNDSTVRFPSHYKQDGNSVRCIKD